MTNVPEYFGSMVFNDQKMKARLPHDTYKALKKTIQNGEPLDMDVYDLASWSAICELSERSAFRRGEAMEFPDFTRGAWKTTPAFEIPDVDLAKVGDGNFGKLINIKADDQI